MIGRKSTASSGKKKTSKKVNKKTATRTTKKATKKSTTGKKASKKAATKKPTAATKKAKKSSVPKRKAQAAPKPQAKAKTKAEPMMNDGVSSALQVGALAPDFELAGDDGKMHRLSAYRSQPVIVYFYPRDDTPGCTTEACDFRDNINRLSGKKAVVLGVSKDTIASHQKFKSKHQLNFPLLSDTHLDVHRAYQAWGEKVLYGQKSVGVIRTTVLVDAAGKVAAVWHKVKVPGHVDKVLQALAALN